MTDLDNILKYRRILLITMVDCFVYQLLDVKARPQRNQSLPH